MAPLYEAWRGAQALALHGMGGGELLLVSPPRHAWLSCPHLSWLLLVLVSPTTLLVGKASFHSLPR